ncbi:MAG: hypothetical protein EKK48_02390 [Candidatus Melainabacteria bacterium]|nr:MAG: hypothetical protein EKK48_02390 [Candidatus Melainabacteria bacterium]
MTAEEREKKQSSSSVDPLALINRIAAEEERVLSRTFVAPVVRGRQVSVQVEGIAYTMSVAEKDFEGWAILKSKNSREATVCGAPTLEQVKNYLQLLPCFRLILLEQFDQSFWSLFASGGDSRAQVSGPIPLYLVKNPSRFQTVCARFDGATFWYESADRRRDPAVARGLRDALQADISPDELHVRNAVPQEKVAYRMLWLRKNPHLTGSQVTPQSLLQRVEGALNHAGAQLDGMWNESPEQVAVRYVVDGHTHVSRIRPGDLSVVSAGICLSGLDQDFDLTSLVGVMRESGYADEY